MQELMTEEIAKTVPRLYGQDGAGDPTVYAHYFSCVNGWDWWLLEFDGTDEAFEMGTAPEGSPELGRLVSDARDEADALVEDGGGWAAVRIGLGDVESIDCESGRTVHVAEEG